MNAAQMIIGMTIAAYSMLAWSADPADEDLPAASLDAYMKSLNSMFPDGGELYCETASGGERHPYESCTSFSKLREQGCFGYSTYDMSMEMRYESMCAKVSALETTQDSKTNYFSLESANWWKSLPAAIIPMSGGVHSDESWEIAAAKRERLVTDKLLGELSFSEIESDRGRFAATVEITKLDCGEVRDRLEFSATLLADFDGDGVAELLLEGYRVDRSDTCSLGTGNSLGASFNVVVNKDGPNAPISVIKVPGIG